MRKIIFFDDKSIFTKRICEYFMEENIEMVTMDTSAKCIKSILDKDVYSLVLISGDLVDFDSKSLVSLIKEINPTINIAVISSDESEETELFYLKQGVNQYIKKSVSMNVIYERLCMLMMPEDSADCNSNILVSYSEHLKLNSLEKVVIKDDKILNLSFIEFDILEFLLKNQNSTISRERFLEEVWKVSGDKITNDPRTVDAHIKNIRKKTGIKSIVTIRSLGYQWVELSSYSS